MLWCHAGATPRQETGRFRALQGGHCSAASTTPQPCFCAATFGSLGKIVARLWPSAEGETPDSPSPDKPGSILAQFRAKTRYSVDPTARKRK